MLTGIAAFWHLCAGAAQLVTYPIPLCYDESGLFSVTVDGEPVPVIQYDDHTVTEYHYAQFSFGGTAEIQVTVSQSITAYRIRPESYGLSGAVDDNTLAFSLSQSRYLLVSINSYQNLVIIADPLETDVPPPSGSGVYNISQSPFSADNTGADNVTGILQSAIDQANAEGGGTVYVPKGVYKISSVTMLSNVGLYLEGGAVLRGTGVTPDYHQDNSAGNSQWITTFIRFQEGAVHMKLWGRGTLDANGETLYEHGGGSDPGALRICGIRPNKNSHVTVDGLIISHGRTWTIAPQQSDNVLIQNVKVLNSENRNENDGIDINSCQEVLVRHCFTYTNDDSLCVKACTSGNFKGVIMGPDEDVSNVTFDDIVTYGRCAGTKVGIQGATHIGNVWFKNINVLQASRGISIHHTQGTNTMENIHYENIYVEDLVYRIYNPYPIQMEITSGGNVRNITLSNINFKKFGDGTSPDGYNGARSRIRGLNASSTIENVRFTDLRIGGRLILDNSLNRFSINEYATGIIFTASGFEAEALPFQVSVGDSHIVLENSGASGGFFARGNFNAAGDYVQYTLDIIQPGTYRVVVRHGLYSTRGMWQLQIDGVDQGDIVDGYKSGSILFQEVDLGPVTFDTAGGKSFRFVVTGKHPDSASFGTGIDLIQLVRVPVISEPVLTYWDASGQLVSGLTPQGRVETQTDITFPIRATVIMALYNSDNALVDIKTVSACDSSTNIFGTGVSLDLPETVEGHSVKVLVWESLDKLNPFPF